MKDLWTELEKRWLIYELTKKRIDREKKLERILK